MENWPLYQQGSSGENVRTIQYLLDAQGHALVVDGDYGPLTAAAVTDFQKANGLDVDGATGPQTWPRLIVQVQAGATGQAVRAVQSQLNTRNAGLAVDGSFGPATGQAVQVFQTFVGVAVDGVVGPVTWSLLADTTAAATNLTIGPEITVDLTAAAAAPLPKSDFLGLRTNECFYAYDPGTTTYWAGVALIPDPNSIDAQVSQQDDGSYHICTCPAGGHWSSVDTGLGGVGGTPCPITVPAAVLDLWGWAPGSCRP